MRTESYLPFLAGLIILTMNIEMLPNAFSLIFTHAFTPIAATGGFAGAAEGGKSQQGQRVVDHRLFLSVSMLERSSGVLMLRKASA